MAYTTIKKPSDYFETLLSTGDGGSQTFTGLDFQPDFVWSKRRQTHVHQLYDSVRGAGSGKALQSDSSAAEGGDGGTYGYLSSFTSDGFASTAGSSNNNYFNASGGTYAFWNWKANGAGSANTDGSISSTVSANTTSGFSIVSYTGTGANATVGHGLNSAPKMVIVKDRDNGTYAWHVYHVGLGATKTIYLDLTNTPSTSSIYWNNTAPTSSVFSVGTSVTTNNSGDNFIAYCFAEKQGYSKFGSYVGNGNADGTFVYTGFKPAFLMWKRSDVANDWYVVDNKRNIYNAVDKFLYPNLSNAEDTLSPGLDMLSNGYKIRDSRNFLNASGGTYIYMAFAEQPLVGDNPATAR